MSAADQLGSNLDNDEEVVVQKPNKTAKGPADQYPPPAGVKSHYWIQLEPSDDIPPTGLYVGHNGRGYLIETGKPVRVPWFIKGILDDAVQNMPEVDPTTRQISGHRERRRFDYRLVDEPKEDEEA